MTKETLKTSFECSDCGKRHPFGPYVFAHWDERLTHSCECGTQHLLLRGIARKVDL